jgi:hypothetical protein
MKHILLTGIALMLAGCAAAPTQSTKARVTFYSRGEDKYGSRIATGGRAREGRTVAASTLVPFGTGIQIPGLAGIVGNGRFVCEDRGSAVNRERASYGRAPVIDVYCSSPAKRRRLARVLPEYMEIKYEN